MSSRFSNAEKIGTSGIKRLKIAGKKKRAMKQQLSTTITRLESIKRPRSEIAFHPKSALHYELVQACTEVLSLAEFIHATVGKKGNKNTRELRKNLSKCYNQLTHAIDSIQDRDMTVATLKRTRRNALSLLNETQELVQSTFFAVKSAKEQVKDERPKSVNSLAEVSRVIGPRDPVQETAESYGEAKRKLNSIFIKNAMYKRRMPSDHHVHEENFVVLKVPIVPIFEKGIITHDQYAAAGFKVESEGFYSVLYDQLVIGISRDYVKSVPRMKSLDYAKEVTQVIEQKMGRRFTIVPGAIAYHDSGYLYYWLIEEKYLDKLYRNVGHFRIKQWGFGFQ